VELGGGCDGCRDGSLLEKLAAFHDLPPSIRNFRFAFRLRTNISPFASARNLSCIGFKAKDPVVRHMAFAETKKP
jgi:hypothetical protein